jgi:hypothetical protein
MLTINSVINSLIFKVKMEEVFYLNVYIRFRMLIF